MRDPIMWTLTHECRLTGETAEIQLTDAEKREMETKPGFLGWRSDEFLTRVTEA